VERRSRSWNAKVNVKFKSEARELRTTNKCVFLTLKKCRKTRLKTTSLFMYSLLLIEMMNWKKVLQ
jgi:hypothetical protein